MARRPRTLVQDHRDRFEIFIDTKDPVPAREIGRLLSTLDQSFNRFAREEMGARGFRLQIVETATDSWWAILQAAHAMYDVSKDFPELMPFFMHNLDVVIKTMLEQGPAETPKYLRDLARRIGRAGVSAGADAIALIGITRIVLDRKALAELQIPDPEPTDRATKQASPPSLESRAGVRMLADAASLGTAGGLARGGRLFGTLFKVAGRWYARAEGMHGILIPLKLDTLGTLTALDGRAYRIEGELERSPEGYPIAIDVKRLHHIPDDPEQQLLGTARR